MARITDLIRKYYYKIAGVPSTRLQEERDAPTSPSERQERIHGGREVYYLVDENIFIIGDEEKTNAEAEKFFSGFTERDKRLALRPFNFGRMFKKKNKSWKDPYLLMLGDKMIQPKSEIKDKTTLHSGYTFLGQFIDHDLSFDREKSIPDGAGNDEVFMSNRSPSLDLDSLYGRYQDPDTGAIQYDPDLYETDKIRLRVGETQISTIMLKYPNDLPRRPRLPEKGPMAIIGDPRNDENLGVAQTHVAFLKFHNAVVKLLRSKSVPEAKLRESARQLVIRHYQWIILYDFLPEIIDPAILSEVIGWAKKEPVDPRLNWLGAKKPFVPLEFAGAAFRLGHSLVQGLYEWNNIFDSDSSDGIAKFEELFIFTGRGGLDGFAQLPSLWIIDWRRFFDFSDYQIPMHKNFNFARRIDPLIVNNFGNLGNVPDILGEMNLAKRNLLRNRYFSLPSGQEVAALLGAKLAGRPILTKEMIVAGVDESHRKILEDAGFDVRTPLWYYILKEAEKFGGGRRLGPVGSYIVAETLVLLIRKSETSIFTNGWTPDEEPVIPYKDSAKKFRMIDLLKFTDDDEAVINPLGESSQL